jgi:crotonobetainyl-CoA:carnitine CoA-transferase CaiB-like acyl-CoA transferase
MTCDFNSSIQLADPIWFIDVDLNTPTRFDSEETPEGEQMTSILDGIKVLDFTQVYAGPFCTLLLKDFGADIIKVERPGAGDLTRNDVPHTDGMEGGPYINLNRGEKSITLNLKEKKGIDICVWSDWST